MQLLNNNEVTFEPIEHKYTDLNGNHLISVSQLISKFKKPFDPTGEIIARVAKREKTTIDDIRERWRVINENSCTYGTNVHVLLEDYILDGKIGEGDNKDWVEQFSKLKFPGKLYSEQLLYSLEFGIAGTTDIVHVVDEKNKVIDILDFKTNKKLEKSSPYGNYMLGHLFFYEDCNFNHYTIQLSLYAYLLECRGYKINDLTIIYFNPETRLMELHNVDYRKNDIIKMINAYKSNKLPKK